MPSHSRLPGLMLAAALVACASARPGENLLHDSSFEPNTQLALPVASWQPRSVPAGGECAITSEAGRTGRYAMAIRVPAPAKLTWYTTAQVVLGLKPGQAYTLSAYVKADGLDDGYGAYCSLAFFDKDRKRIAYHDGNKIKGRTDWQRSHSTGVVPEAAAYAEALIAVHGHGAAWFDDLKLEEGREATAYALPLPDRAALRVLEATRNDAQRILAKLKRRPGRGMVAIFDELGFPKTRGTPDADALASALRRAGKDVARLSAADLSNPFVLAGCDIDALILPYGPYFPARAARPLKAYLRKGRDLVTIGGYAFDALVDNSTGKWLPMDAARAPATPERKVLFDFERGARPWGTHSDPKTRHKVDIVTEPGGNHAIRLRVPSLKRWCGLTSPPVAALSARHTVTRFRAKGEGARIAVEWREHDQSRWRKFINLTPEWREYTVFTDDLNYWRDNPSVGRGGPGDRFHPERAERVMFAFSIEFMPRDAECELWIDDVEVDVDPLAGYRGVRLNARKGFEVTGAGFMRVRPDQLRIFNPVYPLERAAKAAAAPGQFIVPQGLRFDGPFEGWAAIGGTGIDSHDTARYVPLITTLDAYGRPRGPLAGILHYYSGPYAGASIAMVGATNRNIFAEPKALDLLPKIVDSLAHAAYLRDLKPRLNMVRAGQPAEIQLHAANFGRAAVDASVRLQILSEDGASVCHEARRTVALEAGQQAPLEFTWGPKRYERDFYRVRAELLVNGRPVDRAETGFCAWSEPVQAAGPTVALKDNVLRVNGRPAYLLGAQGFWGDRAISGGNPLTWLREFQSMRDHGIRLCRFINVRARWIGRPEEEIRAYEDALVQLSQKCGIVLFFEDKVWPTADPKLYAEHVARSRDIGERYRRVRGMMIDLTNEPRFNITDTSEGRAAFGEFLKARYRSAEAVSKAWGAAFAGFGKEASGFKKWPRRERWDDARMRDLYAYGVGQFCRWAADNRAAIKQADPSRLVSVGMLGSFGYRWLITAPALASLSQDFANRHCYRRESGMVENIKDVDLRLFGKPPSVGEFGGVSHPSFARSRTWTEPTEAGRIARYMHAAHYGLALGAIFVSNWHYRDPSASIFPFGLTQPDLVDRDIVRIYRNLNLLFRLHRPTYVQPQVGLVSPDRHRWTAARHQVTNAVHRAMDWLVGLHVDFGMAPERCISKLPAGVKALVYPVPFCPDDETFAALEQFVARGGHVLVTGDITYDPNGRRTRADRLALFGAKFVKERYPNIEFSKATPSAGRFAYPCIEVAAKGAEALASDAEGRPAVMAKGTAMLCVDPVELHWPAEDVSLYREFLERAGVPRVKVEPDAPDLHAFVVPGENGERMAMLYNTAKEGGVRRARIRAGGAVVELAAGPRSPALAMLDARKELVACEGVDEVRVAGATAVESSMLAMAGALDGQPLRQSAAFFVVGFEAGQVRITHRRPEGLVAEVGHLSDGKWQRLGPGDVASEEGKAVVRVTRDLANEIVLIAERGSLDAARQAVGDLLALRK